MMHADPADLKARISHVVNASEFAPQVRDVAIEEDVDDTGGEFLRIFLRMKEPDKLKWVKFAPLVRAIEDEVASVDDRFPSVRIAESA